MKLNIIFLISALTSIAMTLPIKNFINNDREKDELDKVSMNYNEVGGSVNNDDYNLYIRNCSDGEYGDIEEDEEVNIEMINNDETLRKSMHVQHIIGNLNNKIKRKVSSNNNISKNSYSFEYINERNKINKRSTEDNTFIRDNRKPKFLRRSNRNIGVENKKLNKKAKHEKVGKALKKSFKSFRSSL